MDNVVNGNILMQAVSEVISEFTGQNKVFTAFDVTQKIRGDGVITNIRHSEVKEMVFQEWKDTFCDDYESTLTELKIGDKTMNAFVYHPEGVLPTTHHLAVVDEVEDEEVEMDELNIVCVTKDLTFCEQRLSIPKGFLLAIGLKAGHIVNVSVDISNSRKIVIKKDDGSDTNATLYSINTDGRLRFSRSVLNKIFNQDSFKYNIYLISDKNIVEVIPA
jgi:hypothetical protein